MKQFTNTFIGQTFFFFSLWHVPADSSSETCTAIQDVTFLRPFKTQAVAGTQGLYEIPPNTEVSPFFPCFTTIL